MKQKEKILALMIQKYPDQTWFHARDFMLNHLGELFVGYEAGSRLSELYRDFPEAIEAKNDGRYKLYRFKIENKDALIQLLPIDLSTLIVKELAKKKLLDVDVI